jgi:uncharacterized protein involved in exopolysaccharide biosynthesis
LASLDALRVALQSRLVEVESRLAALEPEILALQQEQQQLQVTLARLQRNVAVVEETYTSLARKVDEERIVSQDEISSLRLASFAAVPDEPSAPRRLIMTLLAGFFGGMATAVFILSRLWWAAEVPVAR